MARQSMCMYAANDCDAIYQIIISTNIINEKYSLIEQITQEHEVPTGQFGIEQISEDDEAQTERIEIGQMSAEDELQQKTR